MDKFYAVTKTSLYRVEVDPSDRVQPIVQKISMKIGAESDVPTGEILSSMRRLAITKHGLRFFDPPTPDCRDPANLSRHDIGYGTSPIVALFRDKGKALECLNFPDLHARDARFAGETNCVLNSIPDNHPSICKCV